MHYIMPKPAEEAFYKSLKPIARLIFLVRREKLSLVMSLSASYSYGLRRIEICKVPIRSAKTQHNHVFCDPPEEHSICQYSKRSTGSAAIFCSIEMDKEYVQDPYHNLTWLLNEVLKHAAIDPD